MSSSDRLESRVTKPARRDPAAVSIREFFGKYYDALVKGEAQPRRDTPITLRELLSRDRLDTHAFFPSGNADPWEEVRDWAVIRLLRKAAAENDAEGCKRLVSYLLSSNLGVRLPKGVLVPLRWKVGRPRDSKTIYAAWVEKGRPATSSRVLDELAKLYYPSEFGDRTLRKKLRDRIRNTIRRHQSEIAATKSTAIS